MISSENFVDEKNGWKRKMINLVLLHDYSLLVKLFLLHKFPKESIDGE